MKSCISNVIAASCFATLVGVVILVMPFVLDLTGSPHGRPSVLFDHCRISLVRQRLRRLIPSPRREDRAIRWLLLHGDPQPLTSKYSLTLRALGHLRWGELRGGPQP